MTATHVKHIALVNGCLSESLFQFQNMGAKPKLFLPIASIIWANILEFRVI